MNTERRPSLGAMIICVVGALSGCSSLGPTTVARDRSDYSSAVAESWKQQALLNVIKLRYSDLPIFLDISQIVSGYSIQTGVTVNGTVSSATAVQGNFGALGGNAIYTDRPTISYTPLTGNRYLRGLMAPVEPKNVFALLQSGYAARFILPFGLDSLNGLTNSSVTGDRVREASPEFNRAVLLIDELQTAGAFGVQVEEDKEKKETTVCFFRGDGLTPSQAEKLTEVKRLLHLPEGQNRYRLISSPVRGTDEELSVNPRSVLQVMSMLSGYVEVPAEHLKVGYAKPGFDLVNDHEGAQTIRVHSGKDKPAGAYVSVYYLGYWFWIDNNDLRTKRSFTILMFLFTLGDSGGKDALPQITIPAQ